MSSDEIKKNDISKVIDQQENISTLEEKIERNCFYEFLRLIRDNQYDQAYRKLYKVLEIKTPLQYQNEYYFYFLLLRKILGEQEYDFSFLENWSFSPSQMELETDSKGKSLFKFKEALLRSDFQEAFTYIHDYEKQEREENENGSASINTQILIRLTDKVYQNCHFSNEERKVQQAQFNQFSKKVLEKDMEGAYQELYQYVKVRVDNTYDNHIYLYALLLKEILGEQDHDFSFLETGELCYKSTHSSEKAPLHLFEKFEDAVLCSNFQAAYSLIQECEQVEKERKNKTKLYIKLFLRLAYFAYLKEQRDLYPKFIKAFQITELEEETNDGLKINSEKDLLNLIENRKYKETKVLLEQYSKKNVGINDSRIFGKTLYLLSILEKAENNKIKFLPAFPKGSYDDITFSPYRNFFTALNRFDYITAYQYAQKCLKKDIKKGESKTEYSIYSYLLSDLLLYQKIKNSVHNVEITEEDLPKLKELYEEKSKIIMYSKRYTYYVLDLIDMIETIGKQGINPSFCKVETNQTNLISQFEDCMNLGDYSTVFELMNQESWMEETKDSSYKTDMIVIKKLLTMMLRKLIPTKEDSKKQKFLLLEPNSPIVEQLEIIKRYVCAGDFLGAKEQLMKMDATKDPEFSIDMLELLSFALNLKEKSTSFDMEESRKVKEYNL